MHAQIVEQFPYLRPAQQRGLTWWVYGTIVAGSACQNAVITALLVFGRWAGVRQYLREWLDDGADKAAPCHTQVEVRHCFAPLLGWVVRWWHPLLRVQKATTFRPEGGRRQPVTQLVPGPGHAWVGRAVAFTDEPLATESDGIQCSRRVASR